MPTVVQAFFSNDFEPSCSEPVAASLLAPNQLSGVQEFGQIVFKLLNFHLASGVRCPNWHYFENECIWCICDWGQQQLPFICSQPPEAQGGIASPLSPHWLVSSAYAAPWCDSVLRRSLPRISPLASIPSSPIHLTIPPNTLLSCVPP